MSAFNTGLMVGVVFGFWIGVVCVSLMHIARGRGERRVGRES